MVNWNKLVVAWSRCYPAFNWKYCRKPRKTSQKGQFPGRDSNWVHQR